MHSRQITCQTGSLIFLAMFFLTNFAPGAEPGPINPAAPVDCKAIVFEPQLWKDQKIEPTLVPWEGQQVVFLTRGQDFDPNVMGRFVHRLDQGWKVYADLIGQSPKPFKRLHDKPTIAAVPDGTTCGLGCGYIGQTGIEVCGFYGNDYPLAVKSPDAFAHYYFYEMGRNYYVFGDRHSCFITGFAVFMRYVCMDAVKCEDPEGGLRKVIEGVEPRFKDSGLGFLDLFTMATIKDEKARRIKDDQGNVIEPSDQPVCYASAMLRLRRENGGDAWTKRFFKYLATSPTADPRTPAGATRQGLFWLISASLAAEKDLSPIFVDEWHLALSPAERANMAKVDWKQSTLTVEGVAGEVTGAE